MSLRNRLRDETRVQHEALEARLDLTRMGFGREELATLLGRFYGYYAPCEEQIAGLPPWLRAELEPRVKTPLLEADLLGLGLNSEAVTTLPRFAGVAPLSAAAALGRWYVFEGSTLGGQMLARRFEGELGLKDGGCAFFRSYGDAVGTRWREFCAILDAATDPTTDDEAVREARATFESLGEWLCGGKEHSR